VVLTFDDGGYDFLVNVAPMLREFGFPATAYIATYYSVFNRPVFDPALSYILWSSRGRTLEMPEVLPAPVRLDTEVSREIADQIVAYTWKAGLSGADKDALLADVSRRVGFDYEAMCAKRLFHLMTADEARQAAKAGAAIELHTHRHRVFEDKARFQREIADNRAHIAPMRDGEARHFCYPGGFNLPAFPEWLREMGVASATTCKPGLATAQDSRFLLPRVIDTCNLTPVEFDSWVSGLAAFVPQRVHTMPGDQLIRTEHPRPASAAPVTSAP
jgi:peptidoglycan/xylan/chitin deacetylase (PgdA/CDA1 family)